jgi:small ligand-binding sensory domain FIST
VNRFASALSEHPVAPQAVGEAAGQIIDQLEGHAVDLVVAFVSPHFGGVAEELGGVLHAVLSPGVLIGATHLAVVGVGREVEASPALSVWAASFDDAELEPVAFDVVTGTSGGSAVSGWSERASELACAADATLLLMGDPFTFPVEAVLGVLGRTYPDLPVIGGMASAANGPGGNRLVVDRQVLGRGAVGAVVRGAGIETVVSQGCQPVGRPFTVTAVDGTHVVTLGGQPAMDRLRELAGTLDDAGREQLQHGLHIGLVVDEHRLDFGPGDFLVRNVVGARADDGALAIAAVPELGQTVQFHVRDAAAAHADLHRALLGHTAEAALLFTCTGRGRALFGAPDHDARAIGDAFGPVPLGGAFCAGELGPVAGHNHVHGFTASLALF